MGEGNTADINFYVLEEVAVADRAVKRSDGDQYCRVINNTNQTKLNPLFLIPV